MIISFFGATWVISNYAYALFLLPVIIFLCVYRLYRTNVIIGLLAGDRQHVLFKYTSPIRRILKTVLFCIGIVCIGLTLLRPQWNKKEQTVMQEGRDVLIALDISRSMLAQDVEPNRLEHAKKMIKQLLPLLSCERIGLLLFSGSAFVQCPLTEDYTAFISFLDHVDVETISSGSTALDRAITKSLDVFAVMPDKKHKLLLILTDGEDFSSNLSSVRGRAQEEGLQVFALGLGSSEGAPIPLYNEKGEPVGHQKDEYGAIVISRLNEEMLKSLVDFIGGIYIRATEGVHGLHVIVDRIAQFEKETFEDKTWTQLEEQYPWFLGISLICFVLEWLL